MNRCTDNTCTEENIFLVTWNLQKYDSRHTKTIFFLTDVENCLGSRHLVMQLRTRDNAFFRQNSLLTPLTTMTINCETIPSPKHSHARTCTKHTSREASSASGLLVSCQNQWHENSEYNDSDMFQLLHLLTCALKLSQDHDIKRIWQWLSVYIYIYMKLFWFEW